ncbi:MAG: hypothetical protein GXP10_01205 [Gammaproteobacteria bacterium]|nr:hypothetical protein [Gammaproteobacteria bacterium]
MYSDEYTHYWAEIYVANNLIYHGVTLDQFLADPMRALTNFVFSASPMVSPECEHLPLLPRQVAVKRTLEAYERDQTSAEQAGATDAETRLRATAILLLRSVAASHNNHAINQSGG